jgi:hypothetical protein
MPAQQVPHIQPALARSAREHFQPRYAQPLSDEDGREIATNLIGVFAILKEWRDKRAAATAKPGKPRASRSKKKCEASPASNPE